MSQSTPQNAEHAHQSGQTQSSDGVFAVIADLETRLTSLKQMHEQGSRRQVELDGREADLLARDNDLRQKIAALASRQSEMESMASSLADRQRAFEQSVTALDSRQAELDRLASQAAQIREEADRRAAAAAAAERAVADQTQALQQRRAEMERQAASIREAGQEVVAKSSELEQRENELAEKLEAAQRLQAQAQREYEETKAQLAAMEAALGEREAALQQAAAKLDQQRADLAIGQEKLVEAQRRLAEESARCRAEMEEREQDARDRAAALRELEEHLNERLAEIKLEGEKVERERAMVAEQARTLTEQAGTSDEHASAIHSGRAEQAQIQLGEANAKVAGLQTELEQVRADLSHALDELAQAQAAAGQATSGAAPEELEKRDRTIQQLTDEMEQLRSAAATLQTRLDESETNAASMHGVDEQEIAKREQAITRLKERLDEARVEIESLRERVSQAERQAREARNNAGIADPAAAQRVRLRHGRLRRYKGLLQAQARKIIQAQAALQKRHGECEQILAQREKVASAMKALTRREQQLAAGSTRSGAVMFVACATVILGVLGAVSWTVAEKIWPSTYAAQATIEADAHGRKPAANELISWQTYHEELVKNPQLINVAAERMGRRGLAKLGTPAELHAKLDTDLFVQSSKAGSLTLELREVGRDRAQLVLDTYVTALKSVADAAREGRAEDLGTNIVSPATVLASPVVDKRLQHAGMLLAGGSLAALLAVMLVWSRMNAARQSLQKEQVIDDELSGVDWAKVEASMAKAPVAASNGEKPRSRKPKKA